MEASGGAAEITKSEEVARVSEPSARTRFKRPWPKSGPTMSALAIAVAAAEWVMLGCRFTNNEAPPETNGALKDVPHPAAYVANGYVVMMASPGAATNTMAFP